MNLHSWKLRYTAAQSFSQSLIPIMFEVGRGVTEVQTHPILLCHSFNYLFSHFLNAPTQLVHHVAHLKSFIGAEVVEVVVVNQALVEMPKRFPPCYKQFQNHLRQLLSLQWHEREEPKTCKSLFKY